MTDIKQPILVSSHRALGGGQDISRADRSASLLRLDNLLHAFENGETSVAELGIWLAEAGVRAGTSTVFSTWALGEARAWFAAPRNISLQADGDGIIRYGSGIELVTLGEQTARVACHGLDETGEYLIHLLASFPSNVGDNFYASLEGAKDSEAIRFSNTNVALVSDGAVSMVDARKINLYTLKVGRERTRLYVNGKLQKSKRREPRGGYDKFVIKLIGEHGPDLSGNIHGFEIQRSEHRIDSVFGDDVISFHERMRELLAINNIGEIYHLLKGIDDDWLPGLESDLLDLLSKHVSHRGVQEWIYDEILGRVSSMAAAAWIDKHRNMLPPPILTVRDLSAQFLLTPNKRFALGAFLGAVRVKEVVA